VGDFNSDGRQDLAVASQNPDSGSVLLGRGDGTFALETDLLPVGNYPTSIVAGDFNADGHQDLAVANQLSNDVSVLLGQGDGTFGPQPRLEAGFYPASVAAGDFNADGYQDLVTANAASHDVSLLLGQGDGTFGAQTRFGTGFQPTSIAVGDFNDDGRLDLVVADQASDGVSVLLNQGSLPAHRPVAVATVDAGAECDSQSGAVLTLDGSASSDPDSTPGTNDDIKSFQWFEHFGTPSQTLLGSGQRPTVTLALGQHHLTLRVTDSGGASDTAQAAVAVVDTMPPSLTLTLSPTRLWPPNRRMVPVQATWNVSDVCDPAAAGALTSVTSSEPESASQDVSFDTPGTLVLLRAERSGDGLERVYTLTFVATDSSGNSTTRTGLVTVPHDVRSGATRTP